MKSLLFGFLFLPVRRWSSNAEEESVCLASTEASGGSAHAGEVSRGAVKSDQTERVTAISVLEQEFHQRRFITRLPLLLL